MRKTLSAGVIGLGMGRYHVESFRKHPNVRVVAAADTDPARLEEQGNELGIEKRYTDAMEMLEKEKPDIVCVATPNKFHKPLTLAALEAGCHVLCEKPMAMNAGEAEEMMEAARRTGRRIMINFSFRFTPHARAIRSEVESGTLGDIYYGRTTWLRRRGMPGFGGWFSTKALSGGGPLIDLGVHRLDLALWLMNYPEPDWVLGSTYNHLGRAKAEAEQKTFDVEDLASAYIRFKNGASLVLEASWAGNIRDRERIETHLLGTRGGLRQRNIDDGYEWETELYVERNGILYDWTPHDPIPGSNSAMEHFADAILNDTPHLADGREGLVVMRLLDSIYASAAQGTPVHVSS